MKALVIVDAQIDFMPGGALAIANGDSIVPVINKLLPKFELVVATQDWHPANHASFASNHQGKKPFDIIELFGMDQVLWPDHCVQGTKGSGFHPEMETIKITAIFRKGINPKIDSYSGFFDNSHLHSTGLAGYLREKGANELYFCGLAADICVYFTIIDALNEGFKAVLIEDATYPLNSDEFVKIRKELKEKGVEIMQSSMITNQ
ncbi:MAG: bifunctional nicotinamidase/pyrazinamidase [Bacteroidota bacterium]|nr:bifunctional nicotinamidase/pyrazinamidase [Bacteroidota bacterium]